MFVGLPGRVGPTPASVASPTAISPGIRSASVNTGLGMSTMSSTGSDQFALHRFFDRNNGTHFFTASANERDTLLTSLSSGMKYEGVAFYEDSAPQAGDTAVFRFFDTVHGTHFFTQSGGGGEQASILSTRADLVAEGIAFYAPV